MLLLSSCLGSISKASNSKIGRPGYEYNLVTYSQLKMFKDVASTEQKFIEIRQIDCWIRIAKLHEFKKLNINHLYIIHPCFLTTKKINDWYLQSF